MCMFLVVWGSFGAIARPVEPAAGCGGAAELEQAAGSFRPERTTEGRRAGSQGAVVICMLFMTHG
jgi:hypothetical protein